MSAPDISEESADPSTSPQPRSLFRSFAALLIHPRKVMREILDSGSRRGYRTLPALSGLMTVPSAALSVAAVVEGRDVLIWSICSALSILGFWMYVSVYGYAYRLIGGWFGAHGTNESARLSLAWTQVPFILIWAVVVPLQFWLHEEFFPQMDLPAVMGGSMDELYRLMEMEHTLGYSVANAILYIGGFVAWVWSLFVLGEALECPAWKAGLIKLTALWLHVPLFIILAIPAFALALAFVMLFPPV